MAYRKDTLQTLKSFVLVDNNETQLIIFVKKEFVGFSVNLMFSRVQTPLSQKGFSVNEDYLMTSRAAR
jgi:poly(A) polymerase Pap1